MKLKLNVNIILVLISIAFISCDETPTPKPRGYHRIDLDERTFSKWDSNCPFSFKISSAASIEKNNKIDDPCFWNINYPKYNAKLHLSYGAVNNNLKGLIDQEYKMREKHNAFATKVRERILQIKEKNVNAMVFDIYGTKSATSLQFFVTDSVNHFFRGTLYFYNSPNNDSLAPVIDYLKQDVDTLLESFEWK